MNLLTRIAQFYCDGFRQMTWGRALWLLIGIKLFVIFVILRLIFFRPAMQGMSEEEKQETVAGSIINPSSQ